MLASLSTAAALFERFFQPDILVASTAPPVQASGNDWCASNRMPRDDARPLNLIGSLLRPQRLSLFQRLPAFRILLRVSGSTSWLAPLEASSLLGQLWVLYTTSALSDEPMHPTCQRRTSRSKLRGKSDRIRTSPTMRCARCGDPKPPAAALLGDRRNIHPSATARAGYVHRPSLIERPQKELPVWRCWGVLVMATGCVGFPSTVLVCTRTADRHCT